VHWTQSYPGNSVKNFNWGRTFFWMCVKSFKISRFAYEESINIRLLLNRGQYGALHGAGLERLRAHGENWSRSFVWEGPVFAV
jgi:hypothetical protein